MKKSICRVRLCWLLLIVGLLLPKVGLCKSYLSTTVKYTHYADVRASSTATVSWAPTYDLEIDLRVGSLFQLFVIGAQSTDELRKYFGGGIKVDTPGFLGIGSTFRDYTKGKKNHPLNTSIFAYMFTSQVRTTKDGPASRAAGSNIGINTDIFLFNPDLFLTLQGSLMNTEGNTYGTYSFGLGWEY